MRIGLVSRVITQPNTTIEDVVAEVRAAEAAGFAFLSAPQIFGLDTMTALAIAGRETERIELATGVVPTPPRHPMVLAQQALTTQVACRGRFVLGIGLSHKIVIEDLMGLSYSKPARQMRETLEVLMPLVNGRPASFRGEVHRVNAGLQITAPPVPVVVAALGPVMLKIAGSLADGTATWMTGERTLAEHIVPAICDAAKEANRPAPRVMAALPIALVGDADAARQRASELFQIYGTLPSYRAMLDREGAAQPGDVAVVGDEATLRAALRRFGDAGVTDFAASCFEAEGGAAARTEAFLASEL